MYKHFFSEEEIYLTYKIKEIIYSKKKLKNIKTLRIKYKVLFISRLKATENVIDLLTYLSFLNFYTKVFYPRLLCILKFLLVFINNLYYMTL